MKIPVEILPFLKSERIYTAPMENGMVAIERLFYPDGSKSNSWLVLALQGGIDDDWQVAFYEDNLVAATATMQAQETYLRQKA